MSEVLIFFFIAGRGVHGEEKALMTEASKRIMSQPDALSLLLKTQCLGPNQHRNRHGLTPENKDPRGPSPGTGRSEDTSSSSDGTSESAQSSGSSSVDGTSDTSSEQGRTADTGAPNIDHNENGEPEKKEALKTGAKNGGGATMLLADEPSVSVQLKCGEGSQDVGDLAWRDVRAATSSLLKKWFRKQTGEFLSNIRQESFRVICV